MKKRKPLLSLIPLGDGAYAFARGGFIINKPFKVRDVGVRTLKSILNGQPDSYIDFESEHNVLLTLINMDIPVFWEDALNELPDTLAMFASDAKAFVSSIERWEMNIRVDSTGIAELWICPCCKKEGVIRTKNYEFHFNFLQKARWGVRECLRHREITDDQASDFRTRIESSSMPETEPGHFIAFGILHVIGTGF